MVGYKLSKNDWVTPFFVIFRSVREKLLVTVFFDHPVSNSLLGLMKVGRTFDNHCFPHEVDDSFVTLHP